MDIKSSIPTDSELEDLALTKKITASLGKLHTLEESAMKSLRDVANRIRSSNQELKKYLEFQRQSERLYIQLVTRKSDLVHNLELQKLKEHLKHLEARVEIQFELQNGFREVSGAYKEYYKSLGDLSRTYGQLNKRQNEWQSDTSNLSKAHGDMTVSSKKLDKIESSLQKRKQQVIKLYTDKQHRNGFVEQSMLHLNQAWVKLKNKIKNMGW
jgi:hypothetical protein